MDLAPDAGGGQWVLPSTLDLTAAEALHRCLSARLRDGLTLRLAAGGVQHATTPCVQVLLAAAAAARARGIPFELCTPSAEFTQALRDLGVAHCFGP